MKANELQIRGEYCIQDCQQNHQDVKHPNGGIVMEDFNGGEGFYKLHLDYLNKKQVEEVEEMVRMWNKESKIANKNIKNCIGECLTVANEQRFKDYSTTLKDCLAWLEKQGEKKNTCKREIDDAYLQGICDAICEINKQGKALDPDKVIAWLVANICDYDYYVKLFKKDFGI